MQRFLRRRSGNRRVRHTVAVSSANTWPFSIEVLRVVQTLLTKTHPTPARPIVGPSKTRAELLYEAMVQRIEWQLKTSEAYDTKTASWFALTTLVVSISATALAAEHILLYWLPVSLAGIGTLFWVGIIAMSYRAYQESKISVGPTENDFVRIATDTAYATTDMQLLIGEFIATETIPDNERLLERKASFLSWAVRLSIGEFACYSAAVFITITR